MIIAIVAVVLVMVAFFIKFEIDDKEMVKRGMPKGFYLEHDGKNGYRPCRNGSPLNWNQDKGGHKTDAIRRAWEQFDYEEECRQCETKWKKVKLTTTPKKRFWNQIFSR
jgi:hypothetical protein